MTKGELENDLRTLPDVREVTVIESTEPRNGKLVATVVSGWFAGKDEGARQARVWELLQSRHALGDLRNVEFIFTNAPGEPTDEAA